MSRKRRRKGGGPPRQKQQHRPTALVDIIMPVYGEWNMLERAMATIEGACLGLDGGYRIIVVDNGTPDWNDTDGRTIEPREQSEAIRELLRGQDAFYRLEENVGYPGAVNHGLSKGNSPLVLIWTSDVQMTPGSITEMVRVIDDPEVGIVGAKLLFPTDESPHGPPGMIQHAGISFNIEGHPFHVYMAWPSEHPRANIQQPMAAVTGALMLVRRAIFAETGGFFGGYGGGTFEDMDLCFTVTQMMKKLVIYCPTAWGYHYVGGSIKKGANPQGFNLPMNSTIFRGRWAGALQWDEWRYW